MCPISSDIAFRRRELWWCSAIHLLNDGLIASLSMTLPFIAEDLRLSYAQSGLVRSAVNALISAGQIPMGFAGSRVGADLLLGGSLVWFALSFAAMGLVGGYLALLTVAGLSGLGGSTYHPVATALISRVYPPAGRGQAIGSLNFAGDVGKVGMPAVAGVLIGLWGWRTGLAALGTGAVFVGLFYLAAHNRAGLAGEISGEEQSPAARWGVIRPVQFWTFTGIGCLDQAGRTAAVVFLPFLLVNRGVADASLGWLVSLTFAGGALGKFVCGYLTDRIGFRAVIAVTELLVIAGCLVLPLVSTGWPLLLFLPSFGFVLNGTSSVMYTGLAETLTGGKRRVGYGVYYTATFGASAVAAFLYGLLADAQGLLTVFPAVAGMTLLILPMLWPLR